MKNTIYPCLWFDGKAREAADLYCSLFPDSFINYESPMVVRFKLGELQFMGLNGGPMFTPNASISFFVVCETKEELKKAWIGLLDGGQILMPLDNYPWSELYGWVSDRYGVSWQLSYGKIAETGQKISATLMFTNQQAGKAEEAIKTYTSIFPDSAVTGILRYAAGDPDVEGTIKHAQFKLGTETLMAMDSSLAHNFNFNEGISLVVECDTQEDIDYYWDKLISGGGEESMCGWLKDRYGVSWQIVPGIIGELMSDPAKGGRVMQEIMKMRKIDLRKLVEA